jgi:precorrin-2 dehydrogenase / sirohydrochlorin ferrochelatase
VTDNDLYVACIDLKGRRCLVVGAGPVGTEKVEGLLASGAIVHVVAPEATARIAELALDSTVTWSRREYQAADLDGCILAIAATSTTAVNEAVHAQATSRNMLVNVADVPHLCNFMLPAIVREGPIAVAISTAGASPALAQRMKREAAGMFGSAYAELAAVLEALRPWAKATLPTYADRRAFFDSIVNGDPDPVRLLQDGDRRRLDSLISKAREAALARAYRSAI